MTTNQGREDMVRKVGTRISTFDKPSSVVTHNYLLAFCIHSEKKSHSYFILEIEIINYNIFYQARWESSIKALQHLFPDLHKFLAKRNHTTHSSKHKTITLKHLSNYGCVYLKMQTVWQYFLIKFFAKPNYLQQASWCYWDYTKDDFVPTVCKKNLELSFNCVTLVDQSRAKLLLFELDTGD